MKSEIALVSALALASKLISNAVSTDEVSETVHSRL